jgi:hypothetical protein
MLPEPFEVAWHGAAWRDDRACGPTDITPCEPDEPIDGPLPPLFVITGRRQRKSLVRDAVATLLRETGESLSVWEIHARIGGPGKHTFAGVHSAVFLLKDLGYVERDEQVRTQRTFGQHRAAWRWNRRVEMRLRRAQDQRVFPSARPTAAKAQLPSKAVIGRRGGQKQAASRKVTHGGA